MKRIIAIISLLALTYANADAQCNANFTKTVNGGNVTVTASSTQAGYAHSWRFGDGSAMQHGPTASHNYSLSGTYTISHYLRDTASQCVDTVMQNVSVAVSDTCHANFHYTNDASGRYTFRAIDTVPGRQYVWKLNGQTVSQAAVYQAVLQPGMHSVCLTVSAPGGCVKTQCQQVTVANPQNCNLQASFTYTASTANPKVLSFNGSPSGAGITYHWSFGDGTSGNGSAPTHTYSTYGSYTVRLLVNDTVNRCLDTAAKVVTINPTPADTCSASISITKTQTCGLVSLVVNHPQSALYHIWTISKYPSGVLIDSFPGPNRLYQFADTGFYGVTLVTMTAAGCVSTVYDTVSIYCTPDTGRLVTGYPNPASNRVTMTLNSESEERAVINIYNLSGVLKKTVTQQLYRGNNGVTIPVWELEPGQYFVDIHYGNQRKRSIFQKL
jgi:PKD repeat protein